MIAGGIARMPHFQQVYLFAAKHAYGPIYHPECTGALGSLPPTPIPAPFCSEQGPHVLQNSALLSQVIRLTTHRLRKGGPLLGVLCQCLGVIRASNPFVPKQSYVFFMFYIDEINAQCKGDLICGKPSS